MSKNVEEIVLQARNEASDVINTVAGELGGLGEVLRRLAQTAGPVGLGLAAIGATAGGIVLLGGSLADTVEQLDLMAARTGVSIQQLQVYRQAITEAGGNADSLTTAFTFLNRAIAQHDPLLAKLGITTTDTNAAFLQLSDVFARTSNTAKKTEVAYQLLGRGSADLIGLLPQLGSAFASTEASMRSAGALIGEDTAQQARRLDNQLDALSRNWSGALTRIKAATVPWALDITRAFNDVWDAMSGRKRGREEDLQRRIEEAEREVQQRTRALRTSNFEAAPTADVQAMTDELVKRGYQVVAGRRAAADQRMTAGLNAALTRLYSLREELAKLTAPAEATSDSLDKVTLGAPTEESPRVKRLQELQDVMQVTRAEAERMLATLEQVESNKKRAEYTTALRSAGLDPFPHNEGAAGAAGLRGGAGGQLSPGPMAPFDEQAWNKHVQEVLAGASDMSGEFVLVGTTWQATVEEMTSYAAVLDSTFGALFSGLESGFRTAFEDIAAGTATVGSVLTTLWHSIVNSILAELARLAAAKVLGFVLDAIGFAGFGSAATNKLMGVSATYAAPLDTAATAPTQLVNIYSYDLRDGVRQLTGIGAAQRNANVRVAYAGEY